MAGVDELETFKMRYFLWSLPLWHLLSPPSDHGPSPIAGLLAIATNAALLAAFLFALFVGKYRKRA